MLNIIVKYEKSNRRIIKTMTNIMMNLNVSQ